MDGFFELDNQEEGKVNHVYRRAIWVGANVLGRTIGYSLTGLQDFIENSEKKIEQIMRVKK